MRLGRKKGPAISRDKTGWSLDAPAARRSSGRGKDYRQARLAVFGRNMRWERPIPKVKLWRDLATNNGGQDNAPGLARSRESWVVSTGAGTAHANWRTVSRLRRFLFPHWMAISLALLLLLGRAAMDLLKPWPLKFVFDRILGHGPVEGSTLYLLIGLSVAVVIIALFDGLFSYLGTLFLNRAGRTVVFDLRVALFDHIQTLSLQFHSRKSSGDLLTRVTSDVKALRDILTDDLAEVVYSFIFLLGMGIALSILDWQLTLVAMGAGPLLFLAVVRFTTEIQKYSRVEKKREGALASVFHEALATTRLTRVFNQEHSARLKFEAESAASLEGGLAASLTEERFSWLVGVMGAVVSALVLGFGVQRVTSGAITAGTLIVFVSYIRDFYKPMKNAIKHFNKITRSAASAERVVEVLDIEGGAIDLPGAVHAPRFRGLIEFRGVRFEYEPGRPTLNEINLTIPAGQVTAIVGQTGAGKTTLTSMIPRLYDPDEGAVLIDGVDIRQYTLRSLRSQIGMVFQESVLLRASIAENIAYGRPSASIEEIVAAAKAAKVHDLIAGLPDGYDTEVGERGDTLSGGQRQLIAIARAMIRDTPIIILDEPLVGLDASSAAMVMEALERLMAGRTIVIITHQLALVQRADRLVVMANGRIVQQGNHQELVGTDGRYRELFKAQFKDVLVARP